MPPLPPPPPASAVLIESVGETVAEESGEKAFFILEPREDLEVAVLAVEVEGVGEVLMLRATSVVEAEFDVATEAATEDVRPMSDPRLAPLTGDAPGTGTG